jgi:CRP/FNR family transcriptional regulator
MTRSDIGNYLRLTPETVSRVLRRLQDDAMLRVERRDLELTDEARLAALARPVLRD